MFQSLPILLLLFGSLQTPPQTPPDTPPQTPPQTALPKQSLTEKLCPTRYVHEKDGWAVRLDRKWIVVDGPNIALLDKLTSSDEKKLPTGTLDLLGHLDEFHNWQDLRGWQGLPGFVPRISLESLTPIGAFGLHVSTDRSGSYTREGLKKHQAKLADAARRNAAFINRKGETKLLEHQLVDIQGVRTLRVLVSTRFPDKGSFFLEKWTVPGGDRCFTISMLYRKSESKRVSEACSLALRSFVDGFESAKEAESPFATDKKLELSWPIILLFLLPFLIVPVVFFRSYKRPAPPRAADPE